MTCDNVCIPPTTPAIPMDYVMPRISSALVRILRHPAPHSAQRPGALERLERLATPNELTKAREQQSNNIAA
jgi:hypothetical protein